ncbi:MAG: SufE family protein [Fimbriimonadaceae bacterium]|nr:SufE family protein [Fimbriimonadaceae bacterium]
MPPKLAEIVEEFALYDRSDRLTALVEIGERFVNPSADDVPREPGRRVPGCESEVFVRWDASETPRLRFAVDNPQGISAMAMAEILREGTEGADREAILAIPDQLAESFFGRELSMGKSMGLANMVRALKHAVANG